MASVFDKFKKGSGEAPQYGTLAPVPGQNATLGFDGTAGQHVTLRLTNVTIGNTSCCGARVSMFTVSSIGGMLGIVLSGFLIRSVKPRYLLMLGLFFLGSGSTTTALTSSFPVLLLGQMGVGLAFGFIDISTITQEAERSSR